MQVAEVADAGSASKGPYPAGLVPPPTGSRERQPVPWVRSLLAEPN